MQVEDEGPALTLSPSFRESADDPLSSTAGEGSPHWISAADDRENSRLEDDESSDDLDFAFVVSDPDLGPDITVADDIFSDGRIRPVYPVFNRDLLLADPAVDEKAARLSLRRLLIEDREPCSRSGSVSSSSSSSMDDLEGIPPGTYCVWTPRSVPPSPDRCKKSKSTGSASASRRWRIRDLVVGRSQSDGKDKFVFLASPEKEKEKEKEKRPDTTGATSGETAAKGKGTVVVVAAEENKGNVKGGDRVTEMDMVTAHRLYYAKGGGGSGSARQSFLPYKRNLVGFFVHGNGSSRPHHPF